MNAIVSLKANGRIIHKRKHKELRTVDSQRSMLECHHWIVGIPYATNNSDMITITSRLSNFSVESVACGFPTLQWDSVLRFARDITALFSIIQRKYRMIPGDIILKHTCSTRYRDRASVPERSRTKDKEQCWLRQGTCNASGYIIPFL